MITICMNFDEMELKIDGHAGQAEPGRDIVCAAASTLFYTLAQGVLRCRKMLKRDPVIKEESGAGYLRCKPNEEDRETILRMYWLISEGFQMIRQNYPAYICFFSEGLAPEKYLAYTETEMRLASQTAEEKGA